MQFTILIINHGWFDGKSCPFQKHQAYDPQ